MEDDELGIPEPSSKVDKMERRKKNLSCSFCRPHRNENAGRKPKYGVKKPRHK